MQPSNKKETLTQELGEVFERFARDFFSPQLDQLDVGVKPNIEVKETEQGYSVWIEMAGLDPASIKLSLRDNSLVVQGEEFYRTIPFHTDVDDNNIVAKISDGLLNVELSKLADGTERVIHIAIDQQ